MPHAPDHQLVTAARIDAALARLLAGGEDEQGALLADPATARLALARIRLHGIALALVAYSDAVTRWPEAVAGPLRDEARLQALWEASHRECLVRVLDRLAEAGIATLVLKGTALAYLAHQEPAARRRGDTDLLVREGQLAEVRAILAELGLSRTTYGNFGQEVWRFDTGIGFIHCLDLHWEAAAAPFLRQLIDVDQCFARTVPLPRLAASAWTTTPVLLFLRALINQALHRTSGYLVDEELVFEESRLIWQLDAHFLASGFSPQEWDELATLAAQRGLAPACLAMLRAIAATFGTQVPPQVLELLESQPHENAITRYLARSSGHERLHDDIGALDDVAGRLRLLAGHAFPPGDFMRERYPDKAGWPLSALYLYRLVAGGWQFLGRRGRA